MKISVIGAGYVGLVAAGCFADMGHDVVCQDIDGKKIETLKGGLCPIFEPGLPELIKKNAKAGRLRFTSDFREAVQHCEAIFIAVGTPPRQDGGADLSYVENVARGIAAIATEPKIVVEKSTVPVLTGERIEQILHCSNGNASAGKCIRHMVVSNPEFLREGSAVEDFLQPDRIVIGTNSEKARAVMQQLYAPLKARIVFTDIKSAEIIKHASNSFLAAKISFINAIANICEKTGANVQEVALGMGMDKRIGPSFLNAGLGYGGFCFDADEFVLLGNPSLQLTTFGNAFDTALPKSNTAVLGFDGKKTKKQPVLLLSKRKYHGEMVSIRTVLGRRIKVTADHPMAVVEDAMLELKPAGELKQGDLLPFLADLPEQPLRQIDLVDELAKRKTQLHHVKLRPVERNFADFKQQLLKNLKNSTTKHKYDFFRKNYFRLKDFLALEKNGKMPLHRNELLLFTAKGAATYVPAVIKLNEDFFRLIGYYLAEGNIFYEKGKRGIRARANFHFNVKEQEYIDDVCGILGKMHVKYLITNVTQHKVVRITVSSKVFAFLLDEILCCGLTSYDAGIPSIVFTESKKNRLALLQGLFRGDAYPYFHKNAKTVTIEFGTVSEKLAQGVIILLQSLGIVAGVKKQKMKKSKVPAFIVRISCRDGVRKLVFFDSDSNKKIKQRLDSYKKEIRPHSFSDFGNFFGLRITNIKKTIEKKTVYSLEMKEKPNLFIASYGLIVHNCFPKDVDAFIWIAERSGYDFAMLKEVQKINQQQRRLFVKKVEDLLWVLNGKTIGVLGLAFKPDTDDMRFAPSIDIVNELLREGAKVKAFDPEAMERAKAILPGIEFCNDMYEVAKDADALLFLTEWGVFKKIDLQKVKQLMRQPVICDGRNIFNPAELRQLGFNYVSIGRL